MQLADIIIDEISGKLIQMASATEAMRYSQDKKPHWIEWPQLGNTMTIEVGLYGTDYTICMSAREAEVSIEILKRGDSQQHISYIIYNYHDPAFSVDSIMNVIREYTPEVIAGDCS